MNNDQVDYNSDDEISEKHGQLLKAIEKLDKGQRIKNPARSEPTLQVSEFNLVNSGVVDKDAICVDELVKPLGARANLKEIRKKINATQKNTPVLAKQLDKPIAEKLKREVGFENTAKELRKWDAIVTRNRVAPRQHFPLRPVSLEKKPADEFVKRFRVQSELEKELLALEPENPNKDEEKDKKSDQFSLTLEEILQKRLENAKFRAQQSYKHAKARRQKKIKSKKFHRIERNIKVKEQLKEFAKLQQNDPEAALEKLKELSRARAEERMSLKHKNTSQWARNKQIRAKYDKESRDALAQQLSISRELMQKVKEHEDSDDEVKEDEIESLRLSASAANNPWVNSEKTSSEISEFISDYRKYWDKKHEIDTKEKTREVDNKNEDFPSKSKIASSNPVNKSGNEVEKLVNTVNSKKRRKNKSLISLLDNEKSGDKSGNDNVNENHVNTKMEMNSALRVNNGVIKKAGTSEWCVDTVDSVTQLSNRGAKGSMAIDDIFDTINDKVKQKIKRKLRRIKRKLTKDEIDELENSDDTDNGVTDLSFKKLKLRPELDEALNETANKNDKQNSPIVLTDRITTDNSLDIKTSKVSTVEINPNMFINVKPHHLKHPVVNNNSLDDSILDDSNEEGDEEDDISQQNIISEAFADDDVVDQFEKEKAEEMKKLKSDDVDARLPGWGTWGGNNIKQAMKKKRRFIYKFPQKIPRNDENQGNVIIIEDNSNVKKHQVNDLPYPFSSVSDFETSIRAPIGRNFVPENAHKRLIEPVVKTKMGKVIEPMGEDVLVENKNIKIKNDKKDKYKKNK